MRGLLEFTMNELISNQLLIGQTFDQLHSLIENNLEELREERDVYTHKSINALHLLWKNFEDNNYLLNEAQFKENNYFTANIFAKVKKEYLSVMPVLRQFVHAELPQEGSPGETCADIPRSQRDMLIGHQRQRFSTIREEIKGIDMDEICETDVMVDRQKILKRQWKIIEKCHKEIKEKYVDMWPELTYELNYVQYKNMYETTYSLFNYKIDFCLCPILSVIPHIGIPTWRMFDNDSDIHPFAARSVVWGNFAGIGNVLRNNIISEGEKRQILIRTFLAYQDDQAETPYDLELEVENNQAFHNAHEEPLLLPLVDEID